MTDTMLERAARAIEIAHCGRDDGHWREYVNLARAALEAIREPDEDLLASGPGMGGGDWYTDGRSTAFRCMIDAILSEGQSNA